MTAIDAPRRPLHIDLVEVGGRGGVFQHSVAVGELLAALGENVLIHTATDHEHLASDQSFCTCFTWRRAARRPRSLRVAWWFLAHTLPHLLLTSRRVVWVQGTFKPALTLVLLVALRLTGTVTVFSPHNLFSRSDSRVDAWCIARCLRAASHVVVYNKADHEALRRMRDAVWLLPLLQVTPPVSEPVLRRWRPLVTGGTDAVCAIGQIREDKNLPLLLDAAARAGVRVLVVGPDAGGLSGARQRAAEVQADALFFDGYYELEDLGAVLKLTGIVVCPYRVASQSGVARLAAAYGAVVVATDVGGLGEQADVVIEELTPESVAAAIRVGLGMRQSDGGAPPTVWSDAERDQVADLMSSLR